MAEKMRTMQHNSRANSKGRTHGTKHNDRDFDTGLADNIDQSKSAENIYWHLYKAKHPEMTFTEAELKFYVETFGEQLQKTNDNYLRQSHPERCKDMATWKMARQNAPEETVLQVGKMEGHVSAKELMKCFNAYSAKLSRWNMEHGRPFTQLSWALHVDEAVPHIQTRRVWHYTDEKGITKIGQEKALEKAGVELPNPDKKVSRTNNRKVTFDKMCRAMWLDVLRERGLDIEEIPVPDGKHNREKEDMIRDKYRNIADETARLQEQKKELSAQIQAMQQQRDELAEQTSQLPILQQQMEQAKADADREERRKKTLEAQTAELERKKDGLMTSMEVAELKGRRTLTGGLKDVTYSEYEALKRTAEKVDEMAEKVNEMTQEVAEANARADAAEQKLYQNINWFNKKVRSIDKEIDEKVEELRAQDRQELAEAKREAKADLTRIQRENKILAGKVNRLETAVEYLKAVIKEWLPDKLKMVESRVKQLLSPSQGRER